MGAVNAFEQIAVERKMCTYRFKLIEALMNNNEYDKVQRVLDISIRTVGEEITLYNAIFMFLSLGKSRNLQKLIDAHKSNPDKMFDILDYIEEMNHVASEELKSQILKIIQDGDLEIPESLKMKFSPITKRTL